MIRYTQRQRGVGSRSWSVGFISAALLAASTQLSAQEEGGVVLGAQDVAGIEMPGRCMAWQAGRTQESSGTGPAREVVVAVSDVSNLESKGFFAIDCPERFRHPMGLSRWRNRICHMASKPDEAAQRRFEEKWGERAALLCGSVQRVAGQWRGAPGGVDLENEE